MFPHSKPSEQISVLGSIDPVSQGAGTVTSAWVPFRNHHSLLALISTGVLGAGATLDAKLQQAKDSGGTGVKDITGKGITQIIKATGDNKQALINCGAAELDVEGGFCFVRLSLTVATAASMVSGHLLGGAARYEPASAHNQAAVAQIVA